MNPIIEVAPNITDTQEERSRLLQDAREFMMMNKEDDDFIAIPANDEESELFEESSAIFTIDGEKKEFTYIRSYKNGSGLISFGQDALGLWWYFIRTGITNGRMLKGPYRTKERLLAAMENIHA